MHSCVYRRADGTFREISYDEPGAILIYDNMPPERDVPRPRNIDRPYRNMMDQPSQYVHLLRRLRQSVYCGKEDLTRCSRCSQPVTYRKTADNAVPKQKPAHRAFMMSPERVFRDLVMTDPVIPIRPDLRDALIDTIGHRFQSTASASVSASASTPAMTFPRFMDLPYEIRRMIWLRALPPRVLLWKDLFRDWRYGRAKGVPPESMPHTINQLWRSDLFHVCEESRRIVEAYEGRREACPIIGISSMHKLERGYDELYYPWQGSKNMLSTLNLWSLGDQQTEEDEAPENQAPVLTRKPADWRWATRLQDKDLRMPAVALDVGWIDSGDMHVLAWIGGCYDNVKMEERKEEKEKGKEQEQEGDLPAFLTANRSLAVSPSAAALERLDVVVADILVPVPLRLDRCTAKQHMLLVQDEAGRSTMGHTSTVPALAGRDFTVLVDLYDDWRIDEILSLQTPPPANPAKLNKPRYGNRGLCGQTGLAGRVISKSASHPCIRCTRAEWEARDWRLFGERLGRRLKQLCRPMIVFSVIVEFADEENLRDVDEKTQEAYLLMRREEKVARRAGRR